MILTLNNTLALTQTSGGEYILKDIKGIGLPPIRYTSSVIPQTDRAYFVSNFSSERVIEVEVYIFGDTFEQIENNRKYLTQQIRGLAQGTQVEVKLETDGGYEYVMFGYVQSGELADMVGKRNIYVFSIVCPDPIIYSATLQSQDIYPITQESGIVLPVILPIILPVVNNVVEFTNYGTTYTYPTLTIYGSGTNFKIQNLTTNQTIMIGSTVAPYTLTSQQSIIINTKDSTVLQGGSSIYQYFTGDMIQFAPGVNDLIFSVESGVIDQTRLNVSYLDAYIGI
jgi:Phage tail protein